jgi:hypothetical protein
MSERPCHVVFIRSLSGRPRFEAATANLSCHAPTEVETDNPDHGPLLLTSPTPL